MTLRKIALASVFALVLAGCGDDKDKFSGTWSFTTNGWSGEKEQQITFKKIAPHLYEPEGWNRAYKEADGKLYRTLSSKDKEEFDKAGPEHKAMMKEQIKEAEEEIKENIKKGNWDVAYKDENTLIIRPSAGLFHSFTDPEHEAHRAEPKITTADTEAKK